MPLRIGKKRPPLERSGLPRINTPQLCLLASASESLKLFTGLKRRNSTMRSRSFPPSLFQKLMPGRSGSWGRVVEGWASLSDRSQAVISEPIDHSFKWVQSRFKIPQLQHGS